MLRQRFVYTAERVSKCKRAWDAKDDRTFEWFLWKVTSEQGLVTRWVLNSDDPPEHVTALEAAIFYLRRNRARAVKCPNPGCAGSYFFRQQKNQRFCSTECALPTQRQSKREWWARNRSAK
jgi:hypothetical protein